jgi:4-hydroxy-4-methyl-2-oxoglutarate aldolase
MEYGSEREMLELVRTTLYTPVVGDILDSLGRYHQFLPAPVQPMQERMVVMGRAFPVVMADVDGPQAQPFGRLTEALDDLRAGEVYICGGGSMHCAYWGELLTSAARTRGAVGAVIDGFHRDTPRVLEQDWPVFSRGRYAQDSAVRTKVANFRCAADIGGVWIEPGDLVFGDLDGVVIVPSAIEREVITRALEKARGEKSVRKAIESGMTATDAFRKFGIL